MYHCTTATVLLSNLSTGTSTATGESTADTNATVDATSTGTTDDADAADAAEVELLQHQSASTEAASDGAYKQFVQLSNTAHVVKTCFSIVVEMSERTSGAFEQTIELSWRNQTLAMQVWQQERMILLVLLRVLQVHRK
jgi:hypothetical protein